MDHITFETDYPHADSTFPHTKERRQRICDKAGLDDDERYKLLRGNAIKAFGLERFGITAVATDRFGVKNPAREGFSDAKTVQRAELPGENLR